MEENILEHPPNNHLMSFHMMIAEVNGQLVFINRANELADCNVRVPKIYQYDIDSNLTILEDLGDHSLIDEKNFYQQEKLVRSSLELLNQMHQAKHVDLHSTFWMGLESHSNKFSKVFCKSFSVLICLRVTKIFMLI